MEIFRFNDKWDNFRKKVLPKKIDENTKILYRAIFYSGALSMFEFQSELVKNLAETGLSDKQKSQILSDNINEMYLTMNIDKIK